jgi:ribosomal protein S18 acetylase RimI-like enzyme
VLSEAAVDDVEGLADLFDAYRRFYGRSADVTSARCYVQERLTDGPTRFFVERKEREVRGFVHLLPSFDTLAMRPMWILEDLFVEPSARGEGIGAALLTHAEQFAREAGASRLTLSTAHTNVVAQRLYERHGWVLDTEFRHYHRSLR